MKTRKLEIACPVCASAEVFYTCTPNCCFNHVCAHCGATFEPLTVAKGRLDFAVAPPDPLPDATDPTTACAKCESTSVYLTDRGEPVCGACGTLLELQFTEVMSG